MTCNALLHLAPRYTRRFSIPLSLSLSLALSISLYLSLSISLSRCRIQFGCWRSWFSTLPCFLFFLYQPTEILRFYSDYILQSHSAHLRYYGDLAFCVTAPTLWNNTSLNMELIIFPILCLMTDDGVVRKAETGNTKKEVYGCGERGHG